MVLPSNIVPPDAGWIARELQALRSESREGLASVAASFRSTVDEMAAQVEFLSGQTMYDSRDVGFSVPSSTTGSGILDFDPDVDAHVTIRTSSTGRLALNFGGRVSVWAGSASVSVAGIFRVQILQGGSEVDLLVGGAYLYQEQAGALAASIARQYSVALAPDIEYEVRLRREYEIISSPGTVGYGATWLTATKLGM